MSVKNLSVNFKLLLLQYLNHFCCTLTHLSFSFQHINTYYHCYMHRRHLAICYVAWPTSKMKAQQTFFTVELEF